MKPAKRIEHVEEYYFSRKGREVAAMRAAGADVISLAIGSPDLPPSSQTIETLARVAADPHAHGYQPTGGTPELRRAMAEWYARWYGVRLDAEREVLPLIGSKEGILHTTLALVNVGDEVLVPNPGYPTYTSLSRLLGARVVHYPLREDAGWQPDFRWLEQYDTSRVKILWTNYPNMPTGAPALRETYERLVRYAEERDLVVVNDNPYSFILSSERLSILQVPGAKNVCVEFNSMSKSHNMPGWRVGMMMSNPEIISWALRVKSNIDSGTFRGIQLAAAAALENDAAWHETYNVEVYARRRRWAEEILRALHCTFDPAQVGMFLWGRIPDRFASAEELTEEVLQRHHIFLTPGFIFGTAGERYVRISLCATEENLQKALVRVKG